MPVHPSARRARAVPFVLCALLLGACGTSAASPEPPAPPAADAPADDPDPAGSPSTSEEADVEAPYEVSLVADFGPLPDGTGDAVVTTTWTVDAAGTTELIVDTPVGYALHHVMTDDEHWFWVHPEARATLVDAEWIHFDLRQIEAVGGELPEVVVEGREAVHQPGEFAVGDIVGGIEVLAVEQVGEDEVLLTMEGVERPVVHRRRSLPSDTTVRIPDDAVEVTDLSDTLRW